MVFVRKSEDNRTFFQLFVGTFIGGVKIAPKSGDLPVISVGVNNFNFC